MTGTDAVFDWLRRAPVVAVGIYVAVVGLAGAAGVQAIVDLRASLDAEQAASDTLAALEIRREPNGSSAGPDTIPVAPFLDGATDASASASLLQRVETAVRQAGGEIQSSEVGPRATPDSAGQMAATFGIELPASALSALLYDLEAGTPFLFVDALVAQPAGEAGAGERLRVVLSLSGQREP